MAFGTSNHGILLHHPRDLEIWQQLCFYSSHIFLKVPFTKRKEIMLETKATMSYSPGFHSISQCQHENAGEDDQKTDYKLDVVTKN